MKKLLIASLTLCVCIASIFAYIHLSYLKTGKSLVKINDGENEFKLIGKTIYVNYCVGNVNDTAIIDTGATISSVNMSEVSPKYYQQVGTRSVSAIFKNQQHNLYQLKQFSFLGKNVHMPIVTDSNNSGLNVIGSPEIFGSDKVLLSKNGIFFDDEINKHIEGLDKIPVNANRIIDINGKTQAIYFKLNINGVSEKVLLDTGIAELLTATDVNIKNNSKSIFPSFSLLKTANGLNFSTAYSYDAVISISDKKILTKYKAINNWHKPRARYHLGAEIFNYYSILFDFKNYNYYFIPVS